MWSSGPGFCGHIWVHVWGLIFCPCGTSILWFCRNPQRPPKKCYSYFTTSSKMCYLPIFGGTAVSKIETMSSLCRGAATCRDDLSGPKPRSGITTATNSCHFLREVQLPCHGTCSNLQTPKVANGDRRWILSDSSSPFPLLISRGYGKSTISIDLNAMNSFPRK